MLAEAEEATSFPKILKILSPRATPSLVLLMKTTSPPALMTSTPLNRPQPGSNLSFNHSWPAYNYTLPENFTIEIDIEYKIEKEKEKEDDDDEEEAVVYTFGDTTLKVTCSFCVGNFCYNMFNKGLDKRQWAATKGQLDGRKGKGEGPRGT